MVGREVGRARGVDITTCNYGINYNFSVYIITLFIVIVARLLQPGSWASSAQFNAELNLIQAVH
jgi:hypothetical protein